MTYQLMIVDDEPLARERLKRLLKDHPRFECIAEASDGMATMEWLKHNRSDLLLLDIQMPGQNGLELAEQIQTLEGSPQIIFCTAHDEHALQAFRVKAIDYLLKPIARDDLDNALNRAAQWLDHNQHPSGQRTHLSARTYTGMQLIPLEDVLYCLADQKYVSVFHEKGNVLIDDSLKQLEEEFEQHFLRIHRNALVSRHHIERLEAQDGGGYHLYLKGVTEGLSISRRHLTGVRQAMKRL